MTFTRVEGGNIDDKNKVERKRAIPEGVAEQATQILSSVVTSGTGRAAQIGEFAAGKTGTTENYQDAWFVGFDDDLTVAVWVGYPEGAKPMETEYRGEPVAGGTFPAEIWHDFMVSANKIRASRGDEGRQGDDGPDRARPGVPSAPVQPRRPTRSRRAEEDQAQEARRQARRTAARGARPPSRPSPAPEPEPAPHPPTPAPTPPAGGGSGGSGGSGGAGGGRRAEAP